MKLSQPLSAAPKVDKSSSKPIKVPGSGNDEQNWIWVHNDHIHVQVGTTRGALPVIEARHPISLIMDGELVEGPYTVKGNERIEWKVEEEPLFQILVSEDQMKAFLIVRHTQLVQPRLKNTEPASKVTLELDREAGELIRKLELAEVTRELAELSISHNLDIGSIFQELQEPTYKPVLVAQGSYPVPGKDARMELFFTEAVERSFMEVDGGIDYRNSLKIPSVHKGQAIAKKIKAVDGITGYNVHRQLVIPPKPQDVVVIAREHVEQQGDTFIAMKEGRPRLTGTHTLYLDISTAYIVSGDVNLSTGNIVFSGDVMVYGDVTENMTIEALGTIYVAGCVYNAVLTATGSIIVKGNVVKSKLFAGCCGEKVVRIQEGSRALSVQLEQLMEAARLLTDQVRQKGQNAAFGQVVKLLVHNKFKEIPKLLPKLLIDVHSMPEQDHEAWQYLIQKLKMFSDASRIYSQESEELWMSLLYDLKQTVDKIDNMKETHVKIDIDQCHLSTLQSQGDILIRKEGVLQSDLRSTDNIIFYHNDAVCRGSRLEADGMISASIVGGVTGSLSQLKAKDKIMLRKMYAGRVCVDNFCVDVIDVIENQTIDKVWIMRQLRTS
ncbi:FapA family protein [Paenibacillus periandrae]|uniref:FapA family protein n=1 Tax=Paenibacillus periandrae TaxID=1761741 RepID=UPI001F09D521|nr:FapA family protein [Paenibacillus periandrae]